MSTRLIGNVLLASVVLSACSQPKSQDSGQHEPSVSSAQVAAVASTAINYTCTPSQNIVATYDNSNPATPKAVLIIDGVRYELYAVVSASGARYATEQGIQPEQGMQWHTKGNNAMLTSMSLDHTARPEDEKTMFECTEQAAV